MAGLLAKFFGRTASEGAAFAVGTAVGPALRPIVQDIYNETWRAHPSRPVDAALLAEGVSSRQLDPAWAKGEAAATGISGDRFDRMVKAFDTGPGVSTAFQLWRRGVISQAGFERAAQRESLEPEWIADLVQLHDVLLSPADLAMMRQQGFVDRGRQVSESALSGVTADRADLLFEISGLPPGIDPATEALHRGLIDEATFAQIVREGHTKTKYTDLLLRLARPLLSAATTVNLYLRGWIDAPAYHSRMAEHGYSQAQADDWYDSAGRPAAPVQMQTAWARGVDGPDGRPMDEAQFRKGIRESDIRPEWAGMLWGIRHAYPSLFQLRRAVQDGGITKARALTILRYERYEDADALALVNSWLTGTATGGRGLTAADLTAEYEGLYIDRLEYVNELELIGFSAANAESRADAADARRTKRYRDAAIQRVQKRYDLHRTTEAEARTVLQALNVPPDAIDLLLTVWNVGREEKIAVLTPTQVKTAFRKSILSRAQALAELDDRGYTPADAAILLDE